MINSNNQTKSWDKTGTPDTKPTGDDKKMGTDPRPKAGSGDPKKV